MLSYVTRTTATRNIILSICSHHSEGITLEKPTSGAMMETWRDKGCQEHRFNVLLAQSTNFQHTSLLKCSLKLKLHQLKAYKLPYRSSLTVKAILVSPGQGSVLWRWSNIQNRWATAILTWDKDDSNYQVFHRHTCASGIPSTPYTPAPAQLSTTLLPCNNSSTQMTDASTPVTSGGNLWSLLGKWISFLVLGKLPGILALLYTYTLHFLHI